MKQGHRSRPAIFFIFLFCVAALGAQEKPDRPPWAQPGAPPATPGTQPGPPADDMGQGQAPAPPAKPKEQSSQHGTIKVNVNLVNVLVSVLDEHNRPVAGLTADAFQIFEEGVQQKIDVFETETKLPLDLALMIDSSLSTRIDIGEEREAATHFIQQILRPDDRLAVYAVDESVTPKASFSSDVRMLQEAVKKIPEGSGTSLYDAIYLGSKDLQHRTGQRRRVIILMTDGGETTSRTDFDGARKAAVRGEVLLYTIVIRPFKSENERNTAGEHALQAITDTTGGAMFFPDTARDLPAIFDRINNELRTQYRLAYYPNPRGPVNTYRTIDVKVQAGYKARHRTNYLTGPQ